MSVPDTSVARTTRRGALGITLFWLALMGALYLGFDQVERRQQASYVAHEGSDGELVIPRGPDGHFRVAGRVNGQPVEFLIDTGASSVTVSEAFARAAGLDTVVTPNSFTAHHDFSGALRVLPDLGGVTVARLKDWHNR